MTHRRRRQPTVRVERGGITVVVTAVATGLLVAACGDSDPASETAEPAANTVAVLGTDRLHFEPERVVVPAGEEFTIELTAGAVEHDFTIEAAGGARQVDGSMGDDDLDVVHADAGSTETGSSTVDEPGTYTVYCSVPGHRDAGMEATLEVVNASD